MAGPRRIGAPASVEAGMVALYRRAWLLARLAVERAVAKGVTSRKELKKVILAELRQLHLQRVLGLFGSKISKAVRRGVKAATRVDPGELEAVVKATASWVRESIAALVFDLVGEAIVVDSIRRKVSSLLGNTTEAIKAGADVGKRLGAMAVKAHRRVAAMARRSALRLGGTVNRIAQRAVGVRRYTWRTQRDNRVRDSHAARERKIFRWSDPPSGGHPGSEPNCRCWASPILRPGLGLFVVAIPAQEEEEAST